MEEIQPSFSLREKLVAAGLSETAIREQLTTAYAIMQAVPSVNIRRFNPLENKG